MLYLDTIHWICKGYSPLPAHVLQSSSWLQSYSHDHRRTLTNTILDVEQNLATAPSYPYASSNFKTTYGITHGPGASNLPHVTTVARQNTLDQNLVSADSLGLKISLLDIGNHVNEIQSSASLSDSYHLASTASNPDHKSSTGISVTPSDADEPQPPVGKSVSGGNQNSNTKGIRGTKRSAADIGGNNDTSKKGRSTISTALKASKKNKSSELNEFLDLFYAHNPDKYVQYKFACSGDRRINDFFNRSLEHHWKAGHFRDEFETVDEAEVRFWRAMDAKPNSSLPVSGSEYRVLEYKVKFEALWGTLNGPLPTCTQPGGHQWYDVKLRGGPLYTLPVRRAVTPVSMVGTTTAGVADPNLRVTTSNIHQIEPATNASEQSETAVAAHIPARSLDSILRQAVSDAITPAIGSLRQDISQMQQETNERLNRLEVVTAFVSMAYSNQLGSEYPKFTLEDDQSIQTPRLAYEPSSSTSAQGLGSISTQRQGCDRETPPTEPDAADDNDDDNMQKSSSQ